VPRIEKIIEIKSSPERVFAYVDDAKHVARHLTYGSGRIIGMKINPEASVIKRIENREKDYRFEAGSFVFNIRLVIDKIATGTNLTIIVDYQLPYAWVGRIIDALFIRRYLKREVDKTLETCQKILEEEKRLSKSEGESLVKTARVVVTEFLKNNTKMKLDEKFENTFSFNSGVFVTINNPEGLRGCIGYPLPDKKLFNALVDAAIAAATEDPRFHSVSSDELDKITFEVTVLTPPIEIKVENTSDYPSKIKVGRDGLIVKAGFNSGLLLPQVPQEYGWNEEQFLDHTCEKAGLPKDHWKKKETKIQKFEGIVFKEQSPNGKIVQVIL
jgi:uncharacterized protein (TIGR00296 family)